MAAPRLDRLLRLPIVGYFVRRRILRGLGLERVRVAFYGSAPTPVELIEWYRDLGLELLDAYGLTEVWAVSHLGTPGRLRPGWIGAPLPGIQHRLTEKGEVLVRTPGCMLGYYNAPETTREVIDDDGWVHTGDRGEIDDENRLRITGRVKELFKTSKGKYVAPAPIENRLLAHFRIEQACVTGATMPQPFALLVLSAAARREAEAAREEVHSAMEALRSEINASLDPHERLQTCVVVAESWTVENGLLTPTLKLKRSAIEARYEGRVAGWYASGRDVIWDEPD
jgi:long-subunit acyl-CoA synthetase (AMP-forming)